jgi:isocitrate dehydrogenase (NAD+)
MTNEAVLRAKEHFGALVEKMQQRSTELRQSPDWLDFASVGTIRIGILPGDGIGVEISRAAEFILADLLKDELASGRVEFVQIDGLTIENRAAVGKPIPDDVLAAVKTCHVLLKGPTTTPRKGDPWPNIESANVSMRKELDLFANVRPVRVPEQGIDWIFFRENTEDVYALGPYGIDIDDDISIDFRLITSQGSERIARMAYEYARKNNRTRVTIVTKANVVKTTDGRFLRECQEVGKEYPEITTDDWYIDIMTAKLIDEKRRRDFQVMVLPNLYGDILTDEAAEFQGGVGTAGSANIGKRWAMFEAIHGSAPRMVEEGRAKYADPSSIIRAAAMLLGHIGHPELQRRLDDALDLCGKYEQKLTITGRDTGATGRDFAQYVLETMKDPRLTDRLAAYQAR